MTDLNETPVALVTGGSAGLGLALVTALAADGWTVVTDARHADVLAARTRHLPHVVAVAGDLLDPRHRAALADRAAARGRLDLLIHNASELGPMKPLADVGLEDADDTFATNVLAPLSLTQLVLPYLRTAAGTIVGVSSDAAIEHYPTWGVYGAAKAALDHLVVTVAEETGLRGLAIDPGDLRTAMHQRAFPGEDISDRPLPESVVPHLLALLRSERPSGRYRLADVFVEAAR